jgi:translation initiation factor 3 subunit G
MTSTKLRWGDTLDEDDVLPPTTVSGPDAKGVRTTVEYRKNEKVSR